MSIALFLFATLFIGAFALQADSSKTVPVTVYYESLCSDSIAFFKNKLVPTYTQTSFNYSSFTNLTIIPYGHANETTCQHGPFECDGNRLHACAIKYFDDKVALLNYIACMMNLTSPVNKTVPYPEPDKCAINNTEIKANIATCYNGEEGKALFANNGKETNTFFSTKPAFSVPYVAFNNIRDDKLSSEATKDFKKSLCSQGGITNSAVCSDNPNSGSASLTVTFTLIPAVIAFFFARQ